MLRVSDSDNLLHALHRRNKKPSCCQDSWPYCLTEDYLVG